MPTFREDLHLGHKVPLIETDDLMDGSITASKIARKAIQWWHIACNAIRNCHISDKAVDNRTMDDDSVDERVLVDGLVERLMQPTIDDLQNQINSLWAGGAWISINLSRESITMGETTSVTVTVSTTVSANTITVKMGNTVIGTGEGLGWEGTVTLTPESTTKIIFTAEAEIGDEGKKITSSKALVVNAKVANIYWGDGKITEWPATMVDLFGDEFPLPTLTIGEGVDSSKIEYSAVDPVTGEPATDIVGFGNSKNYKTIEFRHEGDALIVATYTDAGTTVTASYTLHLSKADATNLVYWQEWVLSSKTYAYTTDAEAEDRVIHLIQKTIKTIDSFTFEVSSSRITYDTSNNTVTLPELCASASGEKEVFTVKAKIENDDYYNDLEIPCYVILNKVSPGYEWTPRGPITVTLGQQATYPQLTPKPLDVTVVYSSSNPLVASVGNDGIPTPINASTVPVRISASNDSTEKYLSHEATYSLTVQEQQVEVYWTDGSTRQNTFEYFATDNGKYAYLSNDGHVNLTYKLYNVYGGGSRTQVEPDRETDTIIDYGYPSYIKIHKDTGMVELPRRLSNQLVSSDHYNIDAIPNGGEAVTLDVIIKRGTANFKWSKDAETVNVGNFVDGVYTIPSEQLPHIVADDESREIAYVDNIRQHGEHSSTMVQVEHSRNAENTYTVKVIDANIPQEGIEVQIEAYSRADSWTKTRSEVYTLTILPPATPDYYVGWATGESSSFDGFSALSDEQIATLATGYNISSTPSITKIVKAAEAIGTRQIFFLMWKQDSAPKSGSVTSGGITDTLSAADFVNTNVFRATHNDVTIDGTIYHVAGMRGAFDADDVFVVNFN